MNHAKKIKDLALAFAEATVQYENNGETPGDWVTLRAIRAQLHAAIDEMQAEIERLSAQVPQLRGKVQRMESALRDKDAEIDRLKQDADRYRWLRDESWAGYNCSKRKPQVAETIVFVQDGAGNVKTILAEEALDTAIDAAMKERGEGHEF